MNLIMRLRLVIAGLCLAILACAANGASAQGTGGTDSPAARVCNTDEPRELTEEYRWRWRAHHHLSCVIDTLEQAMHRPVNVGKDQVTLSRDEIES
jgi:hypothetical protein